MTHSGVRSWIFSYSMWRIKQWTSTTLWSKISSHLKWQRWLKVTATVLWDSHVIIIIDHLEKSKTINNEYYMTLPVRLEQEIEKKHVQMKKNRGFHCLTSWSQRQQNCMSYTSNYLRIHPILQIWSPANITLSHTSKRWWRKRDVAPLNRWSLKLKRVLMDWTISCEKGTA